MNGADTFTMPPQQSELWQATANLKWIAPVASRPTAVLHQLWVSMTTGKQEWREVPMEIRSNADV
jgi:hypothetical protein